MSRKKILSVVGARPQFVKAAPVSRALAERFDEIFVHTGQHYDYGMSEIFFQEMEMRAPDFNLGIGGGGHGEQTGKMLIELEKVMNQTKPDAALVYGDTNSTLAAALAAAKLQIPLAHVEAGLRSFNRAMPEEINRVLTDHISAFLFCPTDTAVKNLASEGITRGVHRVGDVMYDALLHNLQAAKTKSNILAALNLVPKQYALATVHRPANTDSRENMSAILRAFGRLGMTVVFPVHPRARKMMAGWNLAPAPNLRLVEPLGHFDMLALQAGADAILTDSGGVQKEAYLVGARCITLRDETEWVETVSAGWNKLTGADEEKIVEAFARWRPVGEHPQLYGEGNAAHEICEILRRAL